MNGRTSVGNVSWIERVGKERKRKKDDEVKGHKRRSNKV